MKYIISAIISMLGGIPLGVFISFLTAKYFVFLEDYGVEILGHGLPSDGFMIFWSIVCVSLIFLLRTLLK